MTKSTFAQFTKRHHSAIVVTSSIVVFATYFIKETLQERWKDSASALQRALSQVELLEAIHNQVPHTDPVTRGNEYLEFDPKTDRPSGLSLEMPTVNTGVFKQHLDQADFNLQLTYKLLNSLDEIAANQPIRSNGGAEDQAAIKLRGEYAGNVFEPEREPVPQLWMLSDELGKWLTKENKRFRDLNYENSLPLDKQAPTGFAYTNLRSREDILSGMEAFKVEVASNVVLADARKTVISQIDDEETRQRLASLALGLIFLIGWIASSLGKLTGDEGEIETD